MIDPVGIIICHGKSELALFNWIKSRLRLSILVVAKDSGRTSIQINSLPSYMKKKYKSESIVKKELGKSLSSNFKIFTVMDTDDCSIEAYNCYVLNGHIPNLNGNVDHFVSTHISTIYNINNLEDVLLKTSLNSDVPRNNKQKSAYSKIFRKHLQTINDIADFCNELEGLSSEVTNMNECIKFMLNNSQ